MYGVDARCLADVIANGDLVAALAIGFILTGDGVYRLAVAFQPNNEAGHRRVGDAEGLPANSHPITTRVVAKILMTQKIKVSSGTLLSVTRLFV